MKIAYIIQKYNKKGGIERCTAELCQRLSDKHEVHVFTTSYADYDDDKIRFHTIDSIKLPKPLFMIEHWLFLKKATSVANKLDFDIVHGGFEPDIITAHSCNRAWIEFKKKNGEFLRYLLNPAQHIRLYMEKQLYNNQKLKKVIAVSEGTKKEVLNYYKLPKEMVTVIPNGVDAKIFSRNDEDRIVLRKEYNLEEDDIVLLFVGNEFLRKGLDVAIKALALLDNKHIKLCVVGGVDKARYINLAKKLKVMDRLIFAGKSVEVEKYYSMADIFVFPTKYEAFSLATLEALAAGLPIIIPKVNGAKEIVIEGETGYLVSREPNAIADKVALILNSNKLERMRFNCIKLAENFTWDLNADRTLKIYEETLSERLDKAEIFCPICRSRSHRLLCIKNNYQIMYCKNCQFKYAIPRPTEKQLQSFYTEEYFNSKNSLGYNDYFSLYEKHYRDIFSQHCKWIKNYCNLNSYVLDVGCGSGYFLKALHDNGYKNLVGIDVSEYAINKNAAKNFKLFASTLNDFMENNMRFDCITMWHILEHYIDPLKEIKDCKQILNKNGYLFIEVPNVNSLGSLIKRCKWAALKPPEHLNFFSPRTACNLINKAGFEVLHCYTPYNFSLKYVPKLFFKLFGKIGLGGYVRIVAKNI